MDCRSNGNNSPRTHNNPDSDEEDGKIDVIDTHGNGDVQSGGRNHSSSLDGGKPAANGIHPSHSPSPPPPSASSSSSSPPASASAASAASKPKVFPKDAFTMAG